LSETNRYFLPYQKRWLEDDSTVKIWEKSRRIGATYVQSYEDVRDIAVGKYPAVWFSSADKSAALEYILYCQRWAKILNYAATDLGEILLDSERDIKAFSIEFANGRRINALSSNPKGFRSKGGKIVLDEFAWHDNQAELWKSAKPAATWGFPIRILSTHHGKGCLFFKFLERAKQGKLRWSVHTTPIQLAVDEGLVDKITGRPTTAEERKQWLDQCEEDAADQATWLEEYCCEAVDEAPAVIPYDQYVFALQDGILWTSTSDLPGDEKVIGDLYAGFDVARKRHLSVIWIDEVLGSVAHTRKVIEMPRMKFKDQKAILWPWLAHPNMRRVCIDEGGLGMQLAEEAQDEFGSYCVEKVTFTNAVKAELAYPLKRQLEDRTKLVPDNRIIRDSFHSVKKIITAAGNERFDADETEETGHADHFWAAALCSHAYSGKRSAPVRILTSGYRFSQSMIRGY